MTDIRPILQSADRALILDVKRRAAIGHLRATAREIASSLFGTSIETGEVVALQDRFESALGEFCEAMRSPSAAVAYTAPNATRAKITAQSQSEKLETENGA